MIADTLNAMMAIPNLIALLLLSPMIFKLTREYIADAGSAPPAAAPPSAEPPSGPPSVE